MAKIRIFRLPSPSKPKNGHFRAVFEPKKAAESIFGADFSVLKAVFAILGLPMSREQIRLSNARRPPCRETPLIGFGEE